MVRSRLCRLLIRSLAICSLLAVGVAFAGDFQVGSRAEYRDLRAKLQAVQFLARATFGYTDDDVDALGARIRQIGERRALTEWIDKQLTDYPATLHEQRILQLMADDNWVGSPAARFYRDFAWWQIALTAPDQLRQRVAFALMQIVVVNSEPTIFEFRPDDASGLPGHTGIVHYYDKLVQNAFGNYRTVLGDVTYHPVMGVFLTHKDNVKPSADGVLLPDENYAREILQLFSMGEFRTRMDGVRMTDRVGNLIQNYTNEDIKSLARVFTGLQYAGNEITSVNLHDPMEIRIVDNHDFNEKVFPNLGLTLPSRTASEAEANNEINAALDHIFSHPNVGPHIARILIQRLVKSNPSRRYIRRVARIFNDNGQGQRGDLFAVVKAILLHPEALRSQRYRRIIDSNRNVVGLRVTTKGSEHSKLVEPVIRYSQFIKLFEGEPQIPSKGFRMQPKLQDLGQLPYRAPSVFNYFRPDYQPSTLRDYHPSRRIPNGQLHAPEVQIYTPVLANRLSNLIYRHLHLNTGGYNTVKFLNSYGEETALGTAGVAAGDFSALLERLDLLMCHGSLREETKTAINNTLVASGNPFGSETARMAIFTIFGSPECAIDK